MNTERETQLNSVVRNYGKWPSDADFQGIPPVVVWKDGKVVFTHMRLCRYSFTQEEVEERKAELQNKPSWDKQPKWVKYLAQNEDGTWYRFEEQPKPVLNGVIGGYCGDDGDGEREFTHHRGEVIGDWHDTLEERPENVATKKESFLVIGNDYEMKPYWHKVTITFKHSLNGEYRTVFWNHNEQCYGHTSLSEDEIPDYYRRVKTDRDEWIELVEKSTGLAIAKGTSGAIYDEVITKYYTKI